MISRSNYEIYFIDYFDGKLDTFQREELFAFLRTNADLEEEFNRYSAFNTEADGTIEFPGKEKLKKDVITNLNYKTWLIGYIENDLSAEQRKDVDNFLSHNSSLKPEFEILKHARLVPDYNIIFDKKNSLRKGRKIILFTPTIKRVISVAAVLLIITLTYYFIHQINTPQPMIVNHKENDSKKSNDIKHGNNQKLNGKTISPSLALNNKPLDKIRKESDSISRINIESIVVKNVNKISFPSEDMALHPFPFNLKLADEKSVNDDVDFTINKISVSDSIYFSDKANKTNFTRENVNDIFDETDLNDLGLSQKNESQLKPNAVTIADLANDGLQKLSKATDISIKKQSDISDNSVTYALTVGKMFFISHKSSGK